MRQDRESCRRRGEEELRKLGISPLPPIQLPTSDEERDEETRRFIRKRYGQDECEYYPPSPVFKPYKGDDSSFQTNTSSP